MKEEEKKLITREKHPGRIAQGHKLAALMKKRKEEILCNKEQSTVQSTERSSVQSTEQPSVQSTVQSTENPSVHSTVQSNDTFIYGVGMLAVLAIGVYAFFSYNTFSLKKSSMEKRINHQNDVICFRSYVINDWL